VAEEERGREELSGKGEGLKRKSWKRKSWKKTNRKSEKVEGGRQR
jgi:hypothetical protein